MAILPTTDLEENEVPSEEDSRGKFLLAMYSQLWNNINRHVLLVWQPVATLGATLGLLSLVDKGVFNLDWATALAITVATWLIAHTMDASTWFDRNQRMIANIERQFLTEEDAKKISPVVGVPRTSTKPILHFRIQSALGYAVIIIMLGHHLVVRVLPTWHWFGQPDWARWLPYCVTALCSAGLILIKRKS